ncbi:M20 aminoacylase family protein [Paraburkholderia tropica]|uniref:M20 aminoacylase family protein n=1 Tax=Paraburkholderia tropica TaxID=92647 RepID=UPI002AB662E5|nr:M20 aminoacylase family protein [Paraburkholderia tropica]
MLGVDLLEQAKSWRHDLHAHPELGYQEVRTSQMVAQLLERFGLEVTCGVGGTGVVGVLENGAGPRIGLRADMDALPMEELGKRGWTSGNKGCMHACGHDGHTSILLATAKHLSETRDFSGRIVFIFQPAEETGAGARKMLEDGLLQRFPLDVIYALHNWPGMRKGEVMVNPGAMMASQDTFDITLTGAGCHAAMPDKGIDPVVAAAHLTTSLQAIVSRTLSPLDSAVVSITGIEAGGAYNIIPERVHMRGTVRCLNPETRAKVEQSIRQFVLHLPMAFGIAGAIEYRAGYPVAVNDAEAAQRVREAAEVVDGITKVHWSTPPSMGSEDFSYFLEAVPGAYFWLGADGETPSAALHNPFYDFNDDLIGLGIKIFASLVKRGLD